MAAEQRVLRQHQTLRTDCVIRRGEPAVPDQRHPLVQRAARAHHLVEPPQVIVAPLVGGREGTALIVARLRAGESLGAGRDQRGHSAGDAEPRQGLGLPGSRPEPGTPQEPLGLLDAEAAVVDRELHPTDCGACEAIRLGVGATGYATLTTCLHVGPGIGQGFTFT